MIPFLQSEKVKGRGMHAGIQIKSKIEYFLQRDGYQKMATDVPEYTLFFRFENQMVYAFMIVDATQNRFLMPDQYRQMKEAMAGPFTARGISDVHIQSLILAEDTESAKNICQNDIFSWVVDVVNEKLMIFEDKVADFYGMASKLEKYLTIEVENYFPEGSQQSVMEGSIADRPAKYIFWINRTLLLLNSVIFLVCMATGDLLYNLGDLNGPSTLGDGEWYSHVLTWIHGSSGWKYAVPIFFWRHSGKNTGTYKICNIIYARRNWKRFCLRLDGICDK